MYNEGISKSGDILDLATELEIITKRGAFFSYGDVRLGQGRENAKEYLRQNLELSNEIEQAVRQRAVGGEIPIAFGGGSAPTEDDDSGYDEEA